MQVFSIETYDWQGLRNATPCGSISRTPNRHMFAYYPPVADHANVRFANAAAGYVGVGATPMEGSVLALTAPPSLVSRQIPLRFHLRGGHRFGGQGSRYVGQAPEGIA